MAYIPLKFYRGNSDKLDKVKHEVGNLYLVEDKNELYYDRNDGYRLKITDTEAIFYYIEGEQELVVESELRLDYGLLDMSILGKEVNPV